MLRWALLSIGIAWYGCEVKPAEISYGHDACHFCKMTIVDRQHASQVVTVKGKAFKYDAIECMLNHLSSWEGPEIQYYLTTDYDNPGQLIDAREAHYLISESIPSPMGEFLSAFSDKSVRNGMIRSKGGEPLTWPQLRDNFRN